MGASWLLSHHFLRNRDNIDPHIIGSPFFRTMFENLTAEADRLLVEALNASGERDPRDYYRDQLKELKESNPERYDAAIEYYRNKLIPLVASGEEEPIVAWMEYGRFLAKSLMPGQTVSIDPSGESHPYEPTTASGQLVLHIPESGKGGRAILVGLPSELSPAQRATYDVLVSGRHKMPG